MVHGMAVPDVAACLNCGAEMRGAYCASCGQKAPHTDLTLREFLHETTEELSHLDGKVPRTLKTLLTKPGLLTVDFLAGRRARWLPPLRVYLICSLAFFVSKPIVEAVTHRSTREVARISLGGSRTGELTAEERRAIEAGLPGRIFGADRLVRASRDQKRLNRAIDSSFPKAMFVLLPLFALLTNIAWRRRMPRYPAHIYLALHLHAAWFVVLAAGTVLMGVLASTAAAQAIGIVTPAYIAAYTYIAMRRVFGESRIRTLLKAAAIAPFYAVSLGATALALLGYAIFTM